MKMLSLSVVCLLAAAVAGQSPLTTVFFGNNGLVGGGVTFVDMTVTVPAITIPRIDVHTNAAPGTMGRVRIWQTLPAFASFSGSEGVAANWQLLAEGPVTAAGSSLPSTVCFATPWTLTAAMGSRGYAFEHIGVGPQYAIGTGSNQNYSTAELMLSAGAASIASPYTDLAGTHPFRQLASSPRVWNGSIHYSVGTSANTCSYSEPVARGCGDSADSFFDLTWSSSLASARLPGRRVTLTPNQFGGYAVTTSPSPGLLPYATHAPLPFLAVPGTREVVQTLTAPFPLATGSAAALVIHQNGMVSVASNLLFLQTLDGTDWAPSVAGLLAAPNTAFYCWHAFDLSGGQISFGEIGSQAVITYQAMASAGQPGSSSTFQFVFDSSNGVVTYAWDAVSPLGLPLFAGDPWLVGYSPGGASGRPERPTDLTQNATRELVATSSTAGSLLLTAAPRPVFGTTVQYSVGTFPGYPTGASYGAAIGLLYFSFANPAAPGLPLPVGRPDCLLNFDLANPIGPFQFVAPGTVLSISTATAALLGVEFWCQAAVVDVAGDVFGSLVTSNALHQSVALD